LTLAKIAARIREDAPFDGGVDQALKELEADPEFKLPGQVDELLKELDDPDRFDDAGGALRHARDRLHELRGGKS
jgi:hypothetical protein